MWGKIKPNLYQHPVIPFQSLSLSEMLVNALLLVVLTSEDEKF